jgi:hypothetical protein
MLPIIYEEEQGALEPVAGFPADIQTEEDEELGPRGRAERFRSLGTNFRRKIFKTIPQIKPVAVVSSAPVPERIPRSEIAPDVSTPLRRGARDRRQPNRLTYDRF